ncbi:Hypothetical predicted protein, partial [Pelobates cultripes]
IGGYIDKSDPWSSNSYLNLLASYSRVSNSTDCWICGTISFSEESSYPYVGVPWTLEELKQYNNTGFGWYREEGKPQSLDRLHIINRPQEGAICISSHNNGANATKMGYSNCTSAWVKGYGNEQHWAMTVKDSSPMIIVTVSFPEVCIFCVVIGPIDGYLLNGKENVTLDQSSPP